METPKVLVNGSYVEAPVEGDASEVFGVESSFDQHGVTVTKTRAEHQAMLDKTSRHLHSVALDKVGIHPPADWGPEKPQKEYPLPTELSYSA